MKERPDLDELIEEIQKMIDASQRSYIRYIHVGTLMDILCLLKEQKAVVRCKDCKWYQEGIDIDGKPFTRCNGNVRVYGHTKPNWFCADGERKGSGHDNDRY